MNKRIVFGLIAFGFLLVWGLYLRNSYKEKSIIKAVSNQYLRDFSELFQNKGHNRILTVKELPKYEGYLILKITEDLVPDKQPFVYTYSFKLNDVYVFVSRLNKRERLLPKELREKLSVCQEGLFLDPYIYYLVINPANLQYIIVDDNQRYINIEELHKEVDTIK